MGLAIGRSGAISGHGSGDIFLAFSTANARAHHDEDKFSHARFIPNFRLDKLFEAVIQAVDEAILNSIFANETMQGFNGNIVEALPHDAVMTLLKEHQAL